MTLTQHPYHGSEDAGVILLTSDGKNLGEWHYYSDDERKAQMRAAQYVRDGMKALESAR